MLDTLGATLTQYFAELTDELLDGIIIFINAIDASVSDESTGAIALSE